MRRSASWFLVLLLLVQISQWTRVRAEVPRADCAPAGMHHCCCGDHAGSAPCGCAGAPAERPAPELPGSPPPAGRDLVPAQPEPVVVADIPAPSPERHDSPRPFVRTQRLPACPVEHRVLHCAYLI